jgi:hypothetical protein
MRADFSTELLALPLPLPFSLLLLVVFPAFPPFLEAFSVLTGMVTVMPFLVTI